jgi:hypothetical protein
MPKLTIGGAAIEGVIEARVQIIHSNPKAPDPVPTMQWTLTLRLQSDDSIPKWALAKQSADRFKKCELIVYNNNLQPAHTWTLLNAYVASYEEVEHPGDVNAGAGEGGFFLDLVVRGAMLESKDYTGDNVMTVAKGEERKLPG